MVAPITVSSSSNLSSRKSEKSCPFVVPSLLLINIATFLLPNNALPPILSPRSCTSFHTHCPTVRH